MARQKRLETNESVRQYFLSVDINSTQSRLQQAPSTQTYPQQNISQRLAHLFSPTRSVQPLSRKSKSSTGTMPMVKTKRKQLLTSTRMFIQISSSSNRSSQSGSSPRNIIYVPSMHLTFVVHPRPSAFDRHSILRLRR
jgi:hypothetical protein